MYKMFITVILYSIQFITFMISLHVKNIFEAMLYNHLQDQILSQ